MNDSKAASFDESQLRHPLEHPYFVASVILSLIVVAAVIVVIVFAPDWLKSHALLSKQATVVRAALVAALAGFPLLALLRISRDDYLKQADGYGGTWVKSAIYFYDVPSVLRRVQELRSAGFENFLRYKSAPSPAPGG